MSNPPALQLAADGAVGEMAEHAALSALLNAFLRETGRCGALVAEDDSEFRVELSSTGQVLCGTIECWSPMGFHRYGDAFVLAHPDSGELVASAHHELVEALVAETAYACGSAACGGPVQAQRLVEQIFDSVQRITRYLGQPRADRPTEPHALTRYAEQSLRLGHPMHPTPKSSPGFTATDSTAYAPELGAGFALHYVAIEQDVLRDDRVAPAMWIPAAVLDAAGPLLGRRRGNYQLLPVHPWQARYLEQRAAFRRLVERDALVPLGALGEPVYPTSSVRTVCDPRCTTVWKLPLRVRITNFFRTNPLEHLQRAADASRVISALRSDSDGAGLGILIETGYRTVRDPELGEDLAVSFRENPFAESQFAPQVMAALLEDRPGALPDLFGYLREAAGLSRSSVEPVAAEVTIEWFRRYLAISVLPILDLWAEHGVSLEAHTQNSLVHLQDGWPSRCYVRDMEGVSISRRAQPLIDLVSADSPLVYDDEAAWSRLRYYLVTNHVGHLVHVLSRCGRTSEYQLWGVLADVLAEHERSGGNPYLAQLRRAPTLPAKANLISRLSERGERPLYVEIPNPIVK